MSSAPNYIQFHIGDYLRDTGDLSPLQHGIYLLLMLSYYSKGRPLPNDIPRLCRRIHAMSLEERATVEYILAEFFELKGPVWMHKRIEEELHHFRAKTEKAQQAANARWEKVKKNNEPTDANALRTQYGRNASQTQTQTHKEVLLVSPAELRVKTDRFDVPYQQIVDLYHELLPELPRVAKLTDARRSHIRARWVGKDAEDLADWRGFFERVHASRFLLGLAVPSQGRKAFRASLDWLTKEENFTKVLEGIYDK